MINAKAAFERFGFSESRAGAVQLIRERINNATNKKAEAQAILTKLIGVDYDFPGMDAIMIRLTMMGTIDYIMQANYEIADGDELISRAVARAVAYRNDPKNSWAFAVVADVDKNESMTAIEGLEVQAVVKQDGTLKKGSKGILAAALHTKHVVEVEADKRPTRQEFMAILIKDVQMTGGGASTYASDLAKKSGVPYRTVTAVEVAA